jgi:hypothetical protein
MGYRFLKPVNESAIIRDPSSKMPLDKNGEFKPWIGNEGTFWRRRVDEGSCIICEKKEGVKFDEEDNIIKKNGGKK